MAYRKFIKDPVGLAFMVTAALVISLAGIPSSKTLAEDDSSDMHMHSKHFNDRMDKVDRNLKEMHRMMHRIPQTEDAGKRRSMMDEHWQKMHETMQMMHGAGDDEEALTCGSMGHHMMGMHDGKGMDNASMAMNQRMMGRCMEAQHQMMQQMMEHEHMRRHQGPHRQ